MEELLNVTAATAAQKTNGRAPGPGRSNKTNVSVSSGCLAHVRGLQPLRSLRDIEFDRLPLTQRPKALRHDCRVMDEHIRSVVTRNEPIPLRVVEPLHLAACHLLPSYGRL